MADPKNPLEMSDEEISGMSAPPPADDAGGKTDEATVLLQEAEAETARVAAEAAEAGEDGLTDVEKAAREAADADADGDNDGDKKDGDPDDVVDPDKKVEADKPELDADGKPVVKDPIGSEAKPDAAAKDSVKADPKDKPAELVIPDGDGLAAFYKQIMTPFKANGKTIELKSPEEAISLMQMGANYTRKLQDIQPHRKMLLMLQNNGLLDEGKLSYLIDLDKKNPEAIKKLVKESGIDPLDIDAADDTAYQPGNHSVTDAEANFRTTMGELVSSSPEGKETVEEIYGNWDDASKEVLWDQPAIMAVIHEQRSTGVYDLIKAEVDRRITLGSIPANTPFLQAYKAVGDEMVAEEAAASGKDDQGKPKPDAKRDVLTTRAAAPKSKLANGDKADAASLTKASAKAAKEVVNPLAMSDEAFLKQMEGRV